MRRPSRRAHIGIVSGAAAVLAIVLLLTLTPARSAVESAFDPAVTASPEGIAAQRAAAERAIQRGYQKAIDQLDTTRGLKVSRTPEQIEAIAAKATADLRLLRRNALTALGQNIGLRDAALARYVGDAEARLDALPDTKAEPGVLLAPRLLAIVGRMNELAAQLADDATREITVPSAPPAASPSARPSPSPGR